MTRSNSVFALPCGYSVEWRNRLPRGGMPVAIPGLRRAVSASGDGAGYLFAAGRASAAFATMPSAYWTVVLLGLFAGLRC